MAHEDQQQRRQRRKHTVITATNDILAASATISTTAVANVRHSRKIRASRAPRCCAVTSFGRRIRHAEYCGSRHGLGRREVRMRITATSRQFLFHLREASFSCRENSMGGPVNEYRP